MEVAEVATAAEDDPELLNTIEKVTTNNTHSPTGISRLDYINLRRKMLR